MDHSFSSVSDFQFNLILAGLFIITAAPLPLATYFVIETIKIGILQESERETNSND